MAADEQVLARAQQRLGTVLRGKYHLDRVLGVGGMASVFAATHRNGKEFAVKLLHADLSLQGDMRSRFLREGYVANAVKHPGAVTVLDDDVTEDGLAFIVMELLEGRTVEALWEQYARRLELPVVVAIGVQLLDVLAAAHAHQIVHRDIKPANLFITRAGQLKVLDFGIARIRDLATSFAATQSGFMLGTPAFMAPEQAAGKVSEIGPQTDLWSAGATLFTLASGRLVHEAESQHELLIKAATSAGRPLSSVLPGAAPLICEIVDRATPFAVPDRWANATAMREALRHASIAAFGKAPSADDLVAALAARTSESTLPVDRHMSPPVRSVPPQAPAPMPFAGGFTPNQAPLGPSHPPPAAPGPPVITAQPVYRSQGSPRSPSPAGIVLLVFAGVVLIAGAITAAVVLAKPPPKGATAASSPSAEPAPAAPHGGDSCRCRPAASASARARAHAHARARARARAHAHARARTRARARARAHARAHAHASTRARTHARAHPRRDDRSPRRHCHRSPQAKLQSAVRGRRAGREEMEARVPLDRTNLPLRAWPLASLCLVSLASPALAANPTKDECITDNENGQRLQKEGKLREAKEQLEVCIASSCPKLVRDDCADRLRAVDAAQPSLVFEAKDAAGAPITAVTVTMDGAPLTDHLDGSALVVDPGEHKLAFGAAGMARLEKTIVVQAGEKNRHEAIVLSAPQPVAPPAPPPPPTPPPAPSSSPPVPAYVALGVGGAGLVVGVLFTGLWASAKSGGNSACVSQTCTSQTASMWESKQTTDTVLLAVGYGVAAIGAGVGAFLLLSQPKPPPPAAAGLSLRIGLGWAGLEGRFR